MTPGPQGPRSRAGIVEDTWGAREMPVLTAAVTLLEQSYMVTVSDIAERTGLELNTVARSLDTLDPTYVDFRKTETGGDPRFWYVHKVTPAARREVGQWPSPAGLIDRLATAFSAAADREADPSQQDRLRMAARLLGDAARPAAIEVAASVIGEAGQADSPLPQTPPPYPSAQTYPAPPDPAAAPQYPPPPAPAPPPRPGPTGQQVPPRPGRPAQQAPPGPAPAAPPAQPPRPAPPPQTAPWPNAPLPTAPMPIQPAPAAWPEQSQPAHSHRSGEMSQQAHPHRPGEQSQQAHPHRPAERSRPPG
jgi:hypothetical protein